MRNFSVLTYNTCFGLKGNTFWDAYNSTYRVFHGRKDIQEIKAKADFAPLFAELKTLSPDVLVLNEVLDDLFTSELIPILKVQGFTNLFVGNSGHHKKPLCVSTLVGTKEAATRLDDPLSFPGNVLGSGGGSVAIQIPSLDCRVLGCHTAFKHSYLKQHILDLDSFYDKTMNTYRNVLFVGDFNRSPEFYKKKSRFGKEMHHATEERTFPSFFPFYKPLSFLSENILAGAVDNIFYAGDLQLVDQKVIASRSDHKMVYAKFEI